MEDGPETAPPTGFDAGQRVVRGTVQEPTQTGDREDGHEPAWVLRRHLRDQAALLALPAMWSSRPSTEIARGLVDVLFSLLRLDGAYVRVDDSPSGAAIEHWCPQHPDPPQALLRAVDLAMQADRRDDRTREGGREGGREGNDSTLALAAGAGQAASQGVLRVTRTEPWFPGVHAVVVTASRRTNYPTELERVLLRVAADQAMLAIHGSRLFEREQAARLEAEAALRVRDEFLTIASHELRTPLTGIRASVQLAERNLRALMQGDAVGAHAEAGRTDVATDGTTGAPTQPPGALSGASAGGGALARAHSLLERTQRQVERLSRLVDDLLDVSCIQAGRLELRRETVDLLALAHEAIEAQRAAWRGREIVLDHPVPDERALTVSADPDRLAQVLTNYLTNALKYSPPDAPVVARVRGSANERSSADGGGVVRVEVCDSGPGLTAEQRARLFERFYRVPGVEPQSGSGVGLGLGLYICRTIVERHGGEVGVESAPGAGSTFWFSLPSAGEPA